MSGPWNGGPTGSPSGDPYGEQPVDPYAGQAAAPVPTYNPYPNPGSWEPAQYLPRQHAPGPLLAGSIVGFGFALLMFVSGLFLVFFGSIVPDSFDEVDTTVGDSGIALVLAGLGNWLAAGLLVAAGVTAMTRRPAGLVLTVVAAGLVVVLAVYWVVLYPHAGIVFWAVVHVLFVVVVAGLVVVPPGNRAWLERAPGSAPPPAPRGPAPYPTDQWGRPFGS